MAEAPPPRVLVVEDHFVARMGIVSWLEGEGFEVVGQAKDGVEAIRLFREHRPDLVLMDLVMKPMGGTETTASIRNLDPAARVLILSSYDSDIDVRSVMDAGAGGYILKEAPAQELREAIRVVLSGSSYLPRVMQEQLATRGETLPLTAQEMQLLELIAQGLSNKEIAPRMSLTAGTIRIYVSNLLAKLGASNRAEAAALATSAGVLRNRRKPSP